MQIEIQGSLGMKVRSSIPFFGPKAVRSCGGLVVHLVDGHYKLGHTQSLGQLSMLTSLPSSLKACLKLSLHPPERCMAICLLEASKRWVGRLHSVVIAMLWIKPE